jgi:hypothetical protein
VVNQSEKMKEEYKTRIQEIIDGMQCPKDFKCVEGGFENLCKAKQFVNEHFLQCLEETSPPCPFAGVYDYGFEMRFCRCPLRVYLAKNLGK